jgi:hypothetical protein
MIFQDIFASLWHPFGRRPKGWFAPVAHPVAAQEDATQCCHPANG